MVASGGKQEARFEISSKFFSAGGHVGIVLKSPSAMSLEFLEVWCRTVDARERPNPVSGVEAQPGRRAGFVAEALEHLSLDASIAVVGDRDCASCPHLFGQVLTD